MATALGHCHSYWSGRQRLVLGARFRFADLARAAVMGAMTNRLRRVRPASS